MPTKRVLTHSLLIFLLLAASCACSLNKEPPSDVFVDLKSLLSFTEHPGSPSSKEMESYSNLERNLPQDDPSWPIYKFLMGEMLLKHGHTEKAQAHYKALIEWATNEHDDDGWGKSSLAAVALWRLLRIYNAAGEPLDKSEAKKTVETSKQLMATRFTRGIFQIPVLTSLPKLEEDILRQLSVLTWNSGMKESALRLFLDCLTISSTDELEPLERKMLQELIANKQATPEYISLLRGQRMLSNKFFKQANIYLMEAKKSENPEISAAALYSLSFIGSNSQRLSCLNDVVEIARNPVLAQNALIRRARLFKRLGRESEYLNDMQRLMNSHPKGIRAADALYELATYYEYKRDTEKSLEYYQRLRNFEGPNDWVNLASFRPALMLYSRSNPGDLSLASDLLNHLIISNPTGPLYLNALFWLGRISDDSGKQEEARKYYERIIRDSPFDYNAIRSRMHLNVGSEARRKVRLDEKSKQDIQTFYAASDNLEFAGTSIYGRRLRNVLESGLYKKTLESHDQIRKSYPDKRIEEISLDKLIDTGLLTPLCLLLAFRQDALAARDKNDTPANHLTISRLMGIKGTDIPFASAMLVPGSTPLGYGDKAALQKDNEYLKSAYPPFFKESIVQAGSHYRVSPDLLYSIVRRESMFYPDALSRQGALGLCQIMPATFSEKIEKYEKEKEWDLPKGRSREDCLRDPLCNLYFGARYLKEIYDGQGDILLSIIEHNVGNTPDFRKWVQYWKSTNKLGDIEFMIETVGFNETRVFARSVVSDMMIVDSLNILKVNSSDGIK
jgi:tetratricopeptide (TPR) repeat protein